MPPAPAEPAAPAGPAAPDARADALRVKRVGRRRVTTAPAPGSDAEPQAPIDRSPGIHAALADEDTARAWGDTSDDNEQRLKHDVPPHY